MPVPSALLDLAVDPVIHDIDLRWTMAYAAALGDHNDRYFDTMRPDAVVAHPLFPVCPEWERHRRVTVAVVNHRHDHR